MDVIKLGGREFKAVVDSTVEHDYWLQGAIARAGLDVVGIQAGELADEFALRILRQTITSNMTFELLGGLMMPLDMKATDWTPELAKQTGDFIKRLTSAEDKQTIQNCILSMLADFFAGGIASLVISRKFSNERETLGAIPTGSAAH